MKESEYMLIINRGTIKTVRQLILGLFVGDGITEKEREDLLIKLYEVEVNMDEEINKLNIEK